MVDSKDAKVTNAIGLYITLDGMNWTEWRNSGKLAAYYADVRVSFDGRTVDLTLEEFKDRLFKPAPEATEYKLPGNVLAFLMTCAGPAFNREDVRMEASLMLKGLSEPQGDR